MSSCKLLVEIKKQIEAGVPAEKAIPWSISVDNEEDYIEVLYYASQVLPDGGRKESIKQKLEALNVRRTESKL